jgi:hypothetical protein
MHRDCDAGNNCPDPSATKMLQFDHKTIACKNDPDCDPKLSKLTPIAADRYDAQRLAVVGQILYESIDGGQTLTQVKGFDGDPAPPNAIVFGGKRNGTDNSDLLLVGSTTGLFARTGPGAVKQTHWDLWKNGVPKAIAIDREDWSTVWVTSVKVIDEESTGGGTHGGEHIDLWKVWKGTNVTDVDGKHEAWTDVTGDLACGDPSAPDIRAIVHVGGNEPYVAVGCDDGVYAARTDDLAHWFKLTGALPNVVVATIDYSKGDDLLVIGTVGRGVWSISNARSLFAPIKAHPTTTTNPHGPNVPPAGPGHVHPGDPVESQRQR